MGELYMDEIRQSVCSPRQLVSLWLKFGFLNPIFVIQISVDVKLYTNSIEAIERFM
jgi:hypothetical protein